MLDTFFVDVIFMGWLQIARAKAVKEEFVRKVQHQAAESRKIADVLADGVITGVGLIQRTGGTGAEHSKGQ
jgi:NADH dehydrogenase (ubiquinone) Fe-S protein 5